MSEMIATGNAKNVEEIKSFLSRQKDTYKVPYDKFPADRPRQCVFASISNRLDFLPHDRGGNRRFLPIRINPDKAEVHNCDPEQINRNSVETGVNHFPAVKPADNFPL